jgi:AraC family transcriptional activator of pyochelin receptor
MDIQQISYRFPLGYPRETDTGAMYHCSCFFEAGTTLHGMPSSAFLGLYFNLGKEMKYEITGGSPHVIGPNQYNMVYIPGGCCDLSFKKGNYAAFAIALTGTYLRLIAESFPALKPFLLQADLKTPVFLHEQHLPIMPDILEKIKAVIDNEFIGISGDMFLKARFTDILILALEHHERHVFAGLDESDLEKIREAYSRIIHSLRAPHAINQIADELKIDPRKLEQGFKILYNTSVYSFLIDQRMKKAVAMLRDTTLPIGDIAVSVGYSELRTFSNTFKKKFGYTPRVLRKKEK